LFTFEGVLACLDGFLNIVLEQVEESEGGEVVNKYPQAFIRGNNGNIGNNFGNWKVNFLSSFVYSCQESQEIS